MVNDEQVGYLHTHVYLYIWCVGRSLADPTDLSYSGLNIAFKLKGGRPWMLKRLVMAVYLIACSHIRISVCSASTTLFSHQRVRECFHRSVPRPSTIETGKRAEQQPRMEPNNRQENRTATKSRGLTRPRPCKHT